METLKVALIQADLIWEDAAANRAKFERLLAGIVSDTALVVLPEMFTTGFSMHPAPLAETMEGETVAWLRQQAKKYSAVITGSLIIQEKGNFYNRLLWVWPDGRLQYYDKRHLFTLAGEHERYTAGQTQVLIEYEGWKIMPLICYDLRFPVWSRNSMGYDLLLYVANFPDKRGFAWRTLLQARAIENQVYTIGLNRVGTDGNGVYYGGDSCLVDYTGKVSHHLPPREMIQQVEIQQVPQNNFRKKMAFLPDRDHFEINRLVQPGMNERKRS